ncbi:hypothetical protein O2K51_06770 [Apibacter raozihei]|uniref:hypothetical protein n=1 Tax=Apibacter raozihei TaxID=2500547 RepID=UPI000FE303AC|nr:hypothetical protein [Apibacter raozihei]
MNYYWKDLYTYDQKWDGLELTIEKISTPNLLLESGNNRKMKLKCKNQILFWAAIDKDYWDVSVIRTFSDRYTFIGNINSQEIEKRKDLSTEEKYKSWSRYYANILLKSENHFFNTSLWILKGYESNTRCIQSNCIFIEKDSFDSIHTGEWDQNLLFSKKVDVDSSRMKWWRKLAKQDQLPPVFAWFIPSIGDYWIIDGNYRLKAAILENKPVSVIAAYSGYYKENIENPKKRQAIMHSVQTALKNKDQLS